jgi:hypothetical protein
MGKDCQIYTDGMHWQGASLDSNQGSTNEPTLRQRSHNVTFIRNVLESETPWKHKSHLG